MSSEQGGSKSVRVTTAGKLLQALEAEGAHDLSRLAQRIGISARRMGECREGIRPLEIEEQILLAALVMEIAPEHGRLARRLHAQAQSALRVRNGEVDSHFVYQQRWTDLR